MSALEIPDAAWRAAGEAVASVEVEHGVRVKGRGAIAPIVNAAAPHIVAAELRRLAAEARKAAEEWGDRAKQCTAGTPAWESASAIAEKRWFLVSHLEMRALELDGGAR